MRYRCRGVAALCVLAAAVLPTACRSASSAEPAPPGVTPVPAPQPPPAPSPPPESRDYELVTSTSPVCSSRQLEEWEFAQNSSLGVKARDPVAHKIGKPPAIKRFWGLNLLGKNWYPVDVYKRTLCGELHHFKFYNGPGAENDWNNFFIPTADFAFLLEDLVGFAKPKDVKDCRGEDDCLEAEITPDEKFFANPWFSQSGQSALVGSDVCTYGPWVYEEAHGNRPEIHPSELYWWKDRDRAATYLMLLQDDSDRFDRNKDFSLKGPPADWWRPWSQAPRTGEFSLAFRVPTGATSPRRFTIDEVEAREVVTGLDPEASADADDGKEHTLRYNGRDLLVVEELQDEDERLGVTFQACRNEADTELTGYVRITSSVGANDRGREGFHVLVVSELETARPPARAERPERTTIDTDVLPQTLRRSADDELIADVAVQIELSGASLGADIDFPSVELVLGAERRPLEFTADELVIEGTVDGVPMLEPPPIEFVFGSETRLRQELPPLGLGGIVVDSAGSGTAAPAATWTGIGIAVESISPLTAVSGNLQRVAQWEIDVYPTYAPLRDGELALEDASPAADRLNEILASGDPALIEEVFGNASPIEYAWSFVATNTQTGDPVPVRVGESAGPGEIRAEIRPIEPRGGVRVFFPEGSDATVFELSATVRLTDLFGMEAEVAHQIWSHVVAADSEAALVSATLSAAGASAGVSPAGLIQAASFDDDATEHDPAARRARIVRLLAERAAEDARVTVGELQQIVRQAKTYAGQPSAN